MTASRTAMLAARKLVLLPALAAAVVALGGCDEEKLPTGPRPTQDFGRARFVNAARDPARTDLRADVRLEGTPFAAGLAYGAGSPQIAAGAAPATFYYPVYTGSRQFVVTRTQETAPTTAPVQVLTQPFTVAASTDYTVLAVGAAPTIEGVVVTDDNTPPAAGQVKFRVINAAPTRASIDVYVTTTPPTGTPAPDIGPLAPTFSGVAYKAASGYVSLPAGNYTFRFTAAGSKQLLGTATVPTAVATGALAAGAIRTVVAFTPATGTATVGATVLSDR